ncbi:MAG: type VI secretion system tip protein VgrG, partial [Planctomycetes bacterium]|nr:type VI secretion system tip protein VgrG [Planctomycetota bacterium]
HEAAPGYETIPFVEQGEAVADRESIHAWTSERAVCTGVCALNDFDFTAPAKSLLAESAIERSHEGPPLEWFDYPGTYTEFADAEAYSRIRIEEFQARHELAQGQSNARGIAPGRTFELADFPRADQCRAHLVVSAAYRAESDAFDGSGQPAGRGPLFECSFTAMSAEETFRPARTTPKPMIRGPQTAVVVGPDGEEIHTDEYGRVKVKFHWDRYGSADENSSCFIRVAQVWAGKKWGGMYIPRIGQEVIVEFLEGDPDRPIITGRVYNGACMPPYDLPGNKTVSTLKSNSSKEGDGFNEVRFEDKKGSEQLFIHAQRNQDIRVGNDCFEHIGHNRHLVVKTDQFEHVENNRSETVDADHVEKIGKDRHLTVKGKEAKSVGGSESFTVTGDVIEVFKKNHNETVTNDYYLKADNIVIEGLTNITINVGNSYIAIDKSGIRIATDGDIELDAKKGISGKALKDIEMKATANLKLEATANASMKGSAGAKVESSAMTEVAGGAMVKVKGGMVMIN